MYEPDAWLCGRVTMEQHFAAGTRSDAEVARTYDGPPRADFVAPGAAGEHASFAIAVDARGKLVWESGEVARRAEDVLWLRYRVEPRAEST